MKKNMGSTDRIVRLVVSVVVAVLIFLNVLSGTLATILGIIAGIFFLTSLIGFCPLYTLFGFSTKK
jgi:uncharacterized membrane protein